MSLLNHPCHVSRPGVPSVVTPRKRVCMGGRWTVENGRRVYHVNTRFECEWVSVWQSWTGITRIVVRTELFATWELHPVADVEMLEAA